MFWITRVSLILLTVAIFGFGGTIDITAPKKISILEKSSVYITSKDMTAQEVLKAGFLKPYGKKIINIGLSRKYVWVEFTLKNDSNATLKRLIIPTWPLIEEIALYNKNNLNNPRFRGLRYLKSKNDSIYYKFPVTLKPKSSKTFLMKFHSKIVPMDIALVSDTKENFYQEERQRQFINTLLTGVVLAFALYSFMIFIYIKDKSSLYYGLYLLAVIYQQIAYLGLVKVFFPLWFIKLDLIVPIIKVNLLLITSALYTVSFLEIKKGSIHYYIYMIFITVSILEIPLFGIPPFSNFYASVATGALFITFNLYSGIYAYIKGVKQARLFIVGFAIVFVSYSLIILDALGLASIMQKYQYLLMIATAFEAMVLMLAYADRYILLQKEKESSDKKLIEEIENRNRIVEAKVAEKTKKLNDILKTKELLIKEIHHRVKNNLQIILSMIRMHNDNFNDSMLSKKLKDLENRINTIAKTYSMLLTTEKLEVVDMNLYINSLIGDIANLYDGKNRVEVKTDIEAKMALKKAVYIGLVVNEIVSNAFEHAFKNRGGKITVVLKQMYGEFILEIEDNGEGEIPQDERGLGLKLINTLVRYQLDGSCYLEGKKYNIRFKNE